MSCCKQKFVYLLYASLHYKKTRFNIELVTQLLTNNLQSFEMGDKNKTPSPYKSPKDIAKIPLPPPPYPTFVTSYFPLQNKELYSPKHSISPYVSVKENNQAVGYNGIQRSDQCYKSQKNNELHITSQSCYELPFNKNSSAVNSSDNGPLSSNIKNENLNEYRQEACKVEENSFVLKSTENVPLNHSELQETRKVEDAHKDIGELPKVFDSPTPMLSERTKIKLFSTPTGSLKRPYSMCDDNDKPDADYKFTPKRSRDSDSWNSNSTMSQNSPIAYHSRKSMPAESAFIRPFLEKSETPDNSVRRKSYPLEKFSSFSPTPRSTNRSCATDQTPYADDDSLQRRKRIKSLLPYYNAFDLVSLESDTGFIDSHCHLDFLFQRQQFSGTYTEYQKKHEDTFPKSYKGCLTIFCNPFTFNQEYMWGKILQEENVWASFGCHPHNAKDYNDEIEKSLCAALKHPKVRALGEIGLDYSNRNNCLKDIQFSAFRRQLKIAVKEQLPVVIHCREAHEDGITIIKEILPKDYTIHLHCFTDTWEWAQKWLEEFPNLFIGITNVVTFPSAYSVHEVAKNIPLSRLLLETDTPYFIPKRVSRETKFSHPGMAIHVAAQIAAIKEIPLEQVLESTRRNTKTMYKI